MASTPMPSTALPTGFPTTGFPTTSFPSSLPTALPTTGQRLDIPDDAALRDAALLYLTLTAAAVAVYAGLQRSGALRWLFEPRGPGRLGEVFSASAWPPRLELREREFVARCGMDAYMSLRGMRLMAKAMLGYLVLSGSVLLPLYRSRPQSQTCATFCANEDVDAAEKLQHRAASLGEGCVCSVVDRCSLANVGDDSALLWVPVYAMAACTAVALWLLRNEYQEVVRIRAAYWLSRPPEMFTILLDDLPAHLGIDSAQSLRDHLDKLFPGKVLRVEPARFRDEAVLQQLRAVSNERMRAFDRLARLQALQAEYGDRVPACHSLCVNVCTTGGELGPRVRDAKVRFEELNVKFADQLSAFKLLEQEDGAGKIVRPLVSSFVTFSSARAAAMATQAILDHRYNVVAMSAPEPDDLRWDSLGFGVKRRAGSQYLARVLFLCIVLFWGVLTSIVGAMTSVSALENEFDSLHNFLKNNAWLRSLLEQSAPLVLSAFVAVVNPVVLLLAKLEARASEGDADRVATIWFFVFLVVQVFIFYGVSGSLLKTLNPILDHPSEIVGVLARTIPQNAAFYIQFVVTKFVTSLCVDLYRVADLSTHALRRVVFGRALTERDQRVSRCGCAVVTFPSHRNLSALNGQMLLVFFIATTYAVIQPLVVPAALCYFAVAYVVYAKVFTSVNMQRFDSGGRLWPSTYWCYVSALLIAQLTLIGMLGLKKGYSETSALLLLFFGTWFVAALIDFHYRRLVLEVPLDIASQVDGMSDAHLEPAEVPASRWRHGELTHHEPNYLGRHLVTDIEALQRREQLSAEAAAASASGQLTPPPGEQRESGAFAAAPGGTAADEQLRPHRPAAESSCSPPSTFARRRIEFYSYALPVTCEPAQLELRAPVLLEPNEADAEGALPTAQELREPFLGHL